MINMQTPFGWLKLFTAPPSILIKKDHCQSPSRKGSKPPNNSSGSFVRRYQTVAASSLMIKDVREEDNGSYQCRAKNDVDTLDAVAELVVQGNHQNYYHHYLEFSLCNHRFEYSSKSQNLRKKNK